MTLLIESLEIDDHILEKVETKHQVSFAEVREACISEMRHIIPFSFQDGISPGQFVCR